MPMDAFIQKYAPHVTGVLSGFDRLVLRGTLRVLSCTGGALDFLWRLNVLLKEFGGFAESLTARLKEASLEEAQRLKRPVRYLGSSRTSKEDVAREIAAKDGVTNGLIAVLTTVEPCRSYTIYRDRERKELVLKPALRKGLQLYHYWMDEDFGFMHGRISTWFPFPVQVCVNGREWLSRRMDRAGIAYRRRDNSFTWIEDLETAQRMMDQMGRLTWPDTLACIARRLNPAHEAMFERYPVDYYWTAYQSEWATDLMFDRRSSVEAMYPLLTRGAMEAFSAKDVMRFLGKKPVGRFNGEVLSDCRRRQEGVRLKHFVKENSVKVYDKGSVLRVETTINNPSDFKTYRPSESAPKGPKTWRKMRKGIADLHRRGQVSQACNERYLHALSTLNTDEGLRALVSPVCRAVRWKGRPARALRPWSDPDAALLQAVNDGAFALNGFRRADLIERLYPVRSNYPIAAKKLAARATRQIRLLRAHALIRKVTGTYRYQVTDSGRKILTAILQYQHLTLQQVKDAAA
jgi:hypothetical protein